MGIKLSLKERALYKRCDEVLHYIWDPIGIAGAHGARDEYESYLPQVYKLPCDDARQKQIADYHVQIESDCMGLNPNPENAKFVESILIAWRVWINNEYS